MKYEDQLKTSAWLQRKYDILYRDNFVCAICMRDNYETQLEVHHIAYFKDGRMAWEYPDYMLVTLCREHHQEEHDKNNIYNLEKIKEWIDKLATPKK